MAIDIIQVCNKYTTLTKKGGTGESEEWAGPCPKCGGNDRFLVWPNQGNYGKFHCGVDGRSGCGWHGDAIDLVQAMENLNYRDACKQLSISLSGDGDTWAIKINDEWHHFPINTTYDYVDTDGKVLYQSLRYTRDGSTKHFGQRQPDSAKRSGWRQGTSGCTLVPYRLPELIRDISGGQPIYVVEGEKAVNYLRTQGISATCTVGGAGMQRHWREGVYSPWFHGATVVVVADNDPPGKDSPEGAGVLFARTVVAALEGVADSVVARMSGNWEQREKQGLDDWLQQGGAIDGLPVLPADGAIIDSPQSAPPAAIDITDEHLGVATDQIWSAVRANGVGKRLYRYGNTLAHYDDVFEVLDEHKWRGLVNRAAPFQKTSKGKDGETTRQVVPPLAMVRDSMRFLPDSVPVVERIVDLPVLDKYGKLLLGGHHPDSSILNISSIHPQPMPTEDALALIIELFQDFPFADEASFANTLAYLLLPFVREMCGATPLHLIDASARGTGKGLLNDLIHAIWGEQPANGDLPLNAEEQRKRITSLLLQSPMSVTFDDVSYLAGHAIQRAITTTSWTDRQLGASKSITVPARCIWAATGNNVILGGDMVRRVVLIRLESQEEVPSQRTGFKRSEREVRRWAHNDRERFVSACLSLVQHGLTVGKTDDTLRMGGFDEYVTVLSTILEGCGVQGFLGNIQRVYDREDTRQSGWRLIMQEWWGRWGDERVRARNVLALIESLDDLDIVIDGETERSRQTTVGKLLKSQLGAVFSYPDVRLKLDAGTNAKGDRVYFLSKIEPQGTVFRITKPSRNIADIADIDIATHVCADARACARGKQSEAAMSAMSRDVPLPHSNEENATLPDGWRWIRDGSNGCWQAERDDDGLRTSVFTADNGGREAVIVEAIQEAKYDND